MFLSQIRYVIFGENFDRHMQLSNQGGGGKTAPLYVGRKHRRRKNEKEGRRRKQKMKRKEKRNKGQERK